MPKKNIDYSKTIIYKICCNDLNITDVYVGHTTDFIKRKYQHKKSCNNLNDLNHYNCKVYEFIRANGNWDNWNMVPIEEYPCENIRQALIRERYWYETLKATLNMDIPSRNQGQYYQENREKKLKYGVNYHKENKEKISEYHKDWYDKKKDEMKEKKICECDSIICKYSYNKHLTSKKHLNYLQKVNSNQ